MKVLLLIFLTFLISCSSIKEQTIKSASCSQEIQVQYEKTNKNARRDGMVAEKSWNAFSVYFLNDFKDEIEVYVNGDMVFKDMVITNKVSGNSGSMFGFNYGDEEPPIIKISISGTDNCIDFIVQPKYKLIYVFRTLDKSWIIRHSNFYYYNE